MKQILQTDAGLKPQHIVKHFTDKFLEHEIESVIYKNAEAISIRICTWSRCMSIDDHRSR